MKIVLELTLPLALACMILLLRLYRDVKRPAARAFGTIIPTLRVVIVDEIRRFNAVLEKEAENLTRSHLGGEVRWKQICVNWAYLLQMTWNTRSFQQTLRFEVLKIDPRKSSLQYEPHERLASELIGEATAMREQLVGWQISLLWRAALGLTIDHETLMTLLNAYKQLEHEMVTLASMADNDVLYQMLIQRLGLDNWGLIDGGGGNPA